jgi:pimeloyl-ACP methyl ester carboxylesterase
LQGDIAGDARTRDMPRKSKDKTGAIFTENHVQVEGFRIRYLEGGKGDPVIMLHGASGLRPSRLNDLLAGQFHVIAFELPGFGSSPVNERSRSMHDLAQTMTEATTKLGLDHFNLVSTAFSARAALWQAIDIPDRIDSLVLLSPSAILPQDWHAPSGTAEDLAHRMYAHPEKVAAVQEQPEIAAKQRALVARLRGPNRDTELEDRLQSIKAPTLVVFGTMDGVIPPEMGRTYVERIPTCYYVLVYEAGHVIAAERPEALHGVVSDFIQRHEAFIVSRSNTVLNP